MHCAIFSRFNLFRRSPSLIQMNLSDKRAVWFGLRTACASLSPPRGGYRYSLERLLPDESIRPSPNVFISHGGPTRTHVNAVRDLLVALGLAPIIVADMLNLNLS